MKNRILITEISLGVLLGISCLQFIGCSRDKSPLEQNASGNQPVNPIIIDDEGDDQVKIADGQPYQVVSQEKTPWLTGWLPAPDSVTARSRAYLMGYFGESYFEVNFELCSSEAIPPEAQSPVSSEIYCVTFYHKISIADYATCVLIATYHDSSGQIVREEGVIDRVTNPALGMPYAVNDSMAVSIALREGLASGIRPWRVSFYFYAGKFQRYVWGIITWNAELSGSDIILDPATGLVLQTSNWAMRP